MDKIEAYAKELGLEIYDVENVVEDKKKIHRITLIKPRTKTAINDAQNGKISGVSVEECEKFSKLISPLFDIEPPVSGEYYLEVSSPGLERKISTLRQFSQSIGENAKITMIGNEKIIGKIISVEDDKISVEANYINAKESSNLSSFKSGDIVQVEFNNIKKARTYFEW